VETSGSSPQSVWSIGQFTLFNQSASKPTGKFVN